MALNPRLSHYSRRSAECLVDVLEQPLVVKEEESRLSLHISAQLELTAKKVISMCMEACTCVRIHCESIGEVSG